MRSLSHACVRKTSKAVKSRAFAHWAYLSASKLTQREHHIKYVEFQRTNASRNVLRCWKARVSQNKHRAQQQLNADAFHLKYMLCGSFGKWRNKLKSRNAEIERLGISFLTKDSAVKLYNVALQKLCLTHWYQLASQKLQLAVQQDSASAHDAKHIALYHFKIWKRCIILLNQRSMKLFLPKLDLRPFRARFRSKSKPHLLPC